MIGGYPTASSAGKVISVPVPTTALTVPAPKPASRTRMTSRVDTTAASWPIARQPPASASRALGGAWPAREDGDPDARRDHRADEDPDLCAVDERRLGEGEGSDEQRDGEADAAEGGDPYGGACAHFVGQPADAAPDRQPGHRADAEKLAERQPQRDSEAESNLARAAERVAAELDPRVREGERRQHEEGGDRMKAVLQLLEHLATSDRPSPGSSARARRPRSSGARRTRASRPRSRRRPARTRAGSRRRFGASPRRSEDRPRPRPASRARSSPSRRTR